MKDPNGTGLKLWHTRQMLTILTACYFNSVYGVPYLFQRPYIWKSATPKPLELEFWYMLSVNDQLLLYDITKRQLHWSFDGYGTPLNVTCTLQAVGRILRLLLPSLALCARLPCMNIADPSWIAKSAVTDRATADWPLLSLTDKYALIYLWKNFTPLELSVITDGFIWLKQH